MLYYAMIINYYWMKMTAFKVRLQRLYQIYWMNVYQHLPEIIDNYFMLLDNPKCRLNHQSIISLIHSIQVFVFMVSLHSMYNIIIIIITIFIHLILNRLKHQKLKNLSYRHRVIHIENGQIQRHHINVFLVITYGLDVISISSMIFSVISILITNVRFFRLCCIKF